MIGFAVDAKGNGEILGLDLSQYWKVAINTGGLSAHLFPKLNILRWHILKQYNPERFLVAVMSLFASTKLDAIQNAQRILGKFAIGETSYLYAVFQNPKEPCILLPYDVSIEDLRRRDLICFTRLGSLNTDSGSFGRTEN